MSGLRFGHVGVTSRTLVRRRKPSIPEGHRVVHQLLSDSAIWWITNQSAPTAAHIIDTVAADDRAAEERPAADAGTAQRAHQLAPTAIDQLLRELHGTPSSPAVTIVEGDAGHPVR